MADDLYALLADIRVDELKKREAALDKLGQDFDGLLSLAGAIRGRAG
jgi:hypothetical protein